MSELASRYDPAAAEKWYEFWETNGYFKPIKPEGWSTEKAAAGEAAKPFVISMPPPNVTGELHLGHAITSTLEDIMIRFHRMKGDPSLWVPGTDHAGIATQAMVERMLAKEGTNRHELGREKFLERVWEWKEKYGNLITIQHRRLGASCDWSRERFTLDEGLSKSVREAFVSLHEKGLIYRANRIINWCPNDHTALSDLEVEHEERNGSLWYVRYPLLSKDHKFEDYAILDEAQAFAARDVATEWIEVATTRPETILGDTAVAVNPDDERFGSLVGRHAVVPAIGRVIKIVGDEAVDAAFGTGAVKVTPAHDPTDYEIGERHGLPGPSIMDESGSINELGGPYAGQDRYEARKNLVADLREWGQLTKVEEHSHAVGVCYRCDTVVEPMVLPQWYVKIGPLADKAIDAVKSGDITIVPERFTKTYMNWMDNIRDWCISRQLWWGHRIPVWYCDDCDHLTVAKEDPTECASCGSNSITQDEDVLDTWFSSGLWPFSTLGWPDETDDLRDFYPTAVMETGYDILFFWVARMIMMGIEMTGESPFHTVYMHGLIRDEKGDKMSKTRGNVVNPLQVIEEYGCDALRFTLSTGSTPGNDMRLVFNKIEGSRNFANKLWNATRLVLSNLDNSGIVTDPRAHEADLSLADRWILFRLHSVVGEVTTHLEEYEFGKAGSLLYDFLWSEFCDWYLELAKGSFYGEDEGPRDRTRAVSVHVLDTALKLLHPYMPYITEELWQKLPHNVELGGRTESIMIAPWPEARKDWIQSDWAKYATEFSLIRALVTDIRRLRSELNVPAGAKIEIAVQTSDSIVTQLFRGNTDYIKVLGKIGQIEIGEEILRPEGSAVVTHASYLAYLKIAGLVDIDEQKARQNKRLAEIEKELKKNHGKLANEGFMSKAPPEAIDKVHTKVAALSDEMINVEELLRALD